MLKAENILVEYLNILIEYALYSTRVYRRRALAGGTGNIRLSMLKIKDFVVEYPKYSSRVHIILY